MFNHVCTVHARSLESVKAADIHPIVYNWYTTMGVFIFSWWVATYLPYIGLPVVTFTPAGFAGGAMSASLEVSSNGSRPAKGSAAPGWGSGPPRAPRRDMAWSTRREAREAAAAKRVPRLMSSLGFIVWLRQW